MPAPQQLQHEFRASEMGATFVALQKFLDTPHVATRHFSPIEGIGGVADRSV